MYIVKCPLTMLKNRPVSVFLGRPMYVRGMLCEPHVRASDRTLCFRSAGIKSPGASHATGVEVICSNAYLRPSRDGTSVTGSLVHSLYPTCSGLYDRRGVRSLKARLGIIRPLNGAELRKVIEIALFRQFCYTPPSRVFRYQKTVSMELTIV